MTTEALAARYSLPLEIAKEYRAELMADVPDSAEFKKAQAIYRDRVRAEWGWTQLGGETYQTAWTPSPKFTQHLSQKFAWMLRDGVEGQLGYYTVTMHGYIDSRLGSLKFRGQPFEAFSIVIANYGESGIIRKPGINLFMTVDQGNYEGLSTLLAMSENLIAQEYDAVRLRSAYAYIMAAGKYKAELDAQFELVRQREQSKNAQLKADLRGKISLQASDLYQKKLALQVAIANEKKSAIRDMQNMLLNAQSLRM